MVRQERRDLESKREELGAGVLAADYFEELERDLARLWQLATIAERDVKDIEEGTKGGAYGNTPRERFFRTFYLIKAAWAVTVTCILLNFALSLVLAFFNPTMRIKTLNFVNDVATRSGFKSLQTPPQDASGEVVALGVHAEVETADPYHSTLKYRVAFASTAVNFVGAAAAISATILARGKNWDAARYAVLQEEELAGPEEGKEAARADE
ncbi:hypothetical protein JCM8097_003586 [Rhodosporidiobolus ruineniae]